MLSRLSGRLGKLMAKTFPNYIKVSLKMPRFEQEQILTPSVWFSMVWIPSQAQSFWDRVIDI
jgi:hypothetical protein